MTSMPGLTGESSNSKVAAVFVDEARAREAARALRDALGLGGAQVQVITARTRGVGARLQPESHGIWRTALRAHAWLGLAGLVAGGLVFLAMRAAGVPFIVNSPGLALFALLFFGMTAGLFAGGLVTLRPDQDPYLIKVREALEGGRTAVVVHAFSSGQAADAQRRLAAAGGDTIATL
jgi:hypothetical protein